MFPNLASLRFQPLRGGPDEVGDWTAHLPFAADMMDALRPSLLVELGTESGDSYFGFCQAIAERGIQCAAFAVGTWNSVTNDRVPTGDLFEEVSAYNTARYRSFSNLLRMNSDEASARFAEESIDLLHLRGYYNDIAVRRDFEIWFPKVSGGGVILIHDIGLRHGDGGVGQFWEEFASRFPSFEFRHTCGLGIIKKPGGKKQSGPFLRVLFAPNRDSQTIRDYYALCADRLFLRLNDHARTTKELLFFSSHLGQAEAEVRALSNDRTRLESSIERLWVEARRSQAELESLRMNFEAAHAQRTALQQSLSWKITSPLRILGQLLTYRGRRH